MLRAVHIDFRAQKLRAEAIPPILRELASLGYNAILMEYMDSFPYEGELAPLRSPDALTKEELASIMAEADRLGLTGFSQGKDAATKAYTPDFMGD